MLETLVLLRLLTSFEFGLFLPLLIGHLCRQLDIHGASLWLTTRRSHGRLSLKLTDLHIGASTKFLLEICCCSLLSDCIPVVCGETISLEALLLVARFCLDANSTSSIALGRSRRCWHCGGRSLLGTWNI